MSGNDRTPQDKGTGGTPPTTVEHKVSSAEDHESPHRGLCFDHCVSLKSAPCRALFPPQLSMLYWNHGGTDHSQCRASTSEGKLHEVLGTHIAKLKPDVIVVCEMRSAKAQSELCAVYGYEQVRSKKANEVSMFVHQGLTFKQIGSEDRWVTAQVTTATGETVQVTGVHFHHKGPKSSKDYPALQRTIRCAPSGFIVAGDFNRSPSALQVLNELGESLRGVYRDNFVVQQGVTTSSPTITELPGKDMLEKTNPHPIMLLRLGEYDEDEEEEEEEEVDEDDEEEEEEEEDEEYEDEDNEVNDLIDKLLRLGCSYEEIAVACDYAPGHGTRNVKTIRQGRSTKPNILSNLKKKLDQVMSTQTKK